jgi:hypothetical protein
MAVCNKTGHDYTSDEILVCEVQNTAPFHMEVIPSVIAKLATFLPAVRAKPYRVFLNQETGPYCAGFAEYISETFPDVVLSGAPPGLHVSVRIHVTTYVDDLLGKPPTDIDKYICHDMSREVANRPDTYFLAPFCKRFGCIREFQADTLPYMETTDRVLRKFPKFVVQGALTPLRRNFTLLKRILDADIRLPFEILLIGKRSPPSYILDRRGENLKIVSNVRDFKEYHSHFRDAYGCLPLISKSTHPQYYRNKLTSSVNYIRAYKLIPVVDKNLQRIYEFPGAIVYEKDDGIVQAFQRAVHGFYSELLKHK